MWFKNLSIYKLIRELPLGVLDFDDLLNEAQFQPCQKMQTYSQGFWMPLGKDSENFTHANGDCFMICQRTESKIIPTSAIHLKMSEKVEKIEREEGRKLSKNEKGDLKGEVLAEMLPNALIETKMLYAYFDLKNKWLVVNSASNKQVEDLICNIRTVLGSFGVVPLTVKSLPGFTMTEWLKAYDLPQTLKFSGSVKLKNRMCASNTANFSDHDLSGDDIKFLLREGMEVGELGIKFDESSVFKLDDTLKIRGMEYTDIVKEKAEDAEDYKQQFDIDFSLMTLENQRIINYLIKIFGGLMEVKEKEEQMEIAGLYGGKSDVAASDVEGALAEAFEDEEDYLYPDAVGFVREEGKALISAVQRKLRIGYNRAARLIERMEVEGVVTPPNDKGKREVIK